MGGGWPGWLADSAQARMEEQKQELSSAQEKIQQATLTLESRLREDIDLEVRGGGSSKNK